MQLGLSCVCVCGFPGPFQGMGGAWVSLAQSRPLEMRPPCPAQTTEGIGGGGGQGGVGGFVDGLDR